MCEKKEPGPCPHCGYDAGTYEVSPHHLPPETILNGKYIVGRVLGEGGFGITYLGWDINLELKVAIKEYYPNGFVARENVGPGHTVTVLSGYRSDFFYSGLDKFVDEARRLAKCWGLSGIVSAKDYFQENKTAYIVMEFVEGDTLKSILKNGEGRLPARQVFEMLRPMMESLETVHEVGLIHRDISPDNIMIDTKGRVKLLDFGAARSFGTDNDRSLSVMLKPGYAPEEQYRSRGKQGPWTDVYGLCATMYRAITGKVPVESLDRLAEDTLQRPSQLGIDIDPDQEKALMKGLALYQRDRYATMGELSSALFETHEYTTDHVMEVDKNSSVAGTASATSEQTPLSVQNKAEKPVYHGRNIWDEAYGHKEPLRDDLLKQVKPEAEKKKHYDFSSDEKIFSEKKSVWDEIYGKETGNK